MLFGRSSLTLYLPHSYSFPFPHLPVSWICPSPFMFLSWYHLWPRVPFCKAAARTSCRALNTPCLILFFSAGILALSKMPFAHHCIIMISLILNNSSLRSSSTLPSKLNWFTIHFLSTVFLSFTFWSSVLQVLIIRSLLFVFFLLHVSFTRRVSCLLLFINKSGVSIKILLDIIGAE